MSALDIRQIAEDELKTGKLSTLRQELRIVVSEKAFDRAVVRGDEGGAREIGGVLVGELLRDDAGPFLRIDATIDALHADEKGAELTFTHATWDHINKEMDSTHADKKIVGWYHTHPGFGIFLSDRDEFIHSSFFNLPFQIAIVYDPKSREHGVFAWRDGEPLRCRRYWVGDREHTWDGARTAHAKEEPASGAARSTRPGAGAKPGAPKEGSTSDREDTSPQIDWKSSLAAALAIAVIAGAAGLWLGTRDARNALQLVDLELQKARAEGVRAAANEIDAELVSVLRTTVGNEATRRPLEQALADLDEAERALAAVPSADDSERQVGLGKVESARDRLRKLRDDRGDAQAGLARLEEVARQASLSPTEVTRELATMRAALGAMHLEMATDAARSGDLRRADRLLTVAASVDPGNRARYEQQRKALAERGPPPPPGGSGSAGRVTP